MEQTVAQSATEPRNGRRKNCCQQQSQDVVETVEAEARTESSLDNGSHKDGLAHVGQREDGSGHKASIAQYIGYDRRRRRSN